MARVLNANLDTNLGGENASNEVISSQKAVKTYVDTQKNELTTNIGDLSDLTTSIKTDLVSAVNSLNIDTCYNAECPAITPVQDIATWTVTHNLGSSNVICSLYDSNGAEILKNTTIDSANQVTITFNANVAVSAGDYKVVVLSDGGTSGGGGSIVVDDILSSTSTNPVQNKVLYPSLSGFIPNGTIIKVGSGSGDDFAKLSDAFNYIAHKWSNGTVTIQLGAETITETEAISSFPECNFPHLLIKGAGVTQTIIECVGRATGGFINSIQTNCDTKFQDICFKNTDTSVSSAAICAYNGGNFNVTNCKSIDFIRGLILTQQGGSFYCGGTLTIENTTATNMQAGVWSNAGNIYFPNGTILKVTNATYGFLMGAGGFVRSNGLIFNINTVTNRYNITRNAVQESGMIIGPITEGTY